MGDRLQQLIFSEAGLVGLLLFLGLMYTGWRERQISVKLDKCNDKILDLSLKTLDTLNKLTEALKESRRQ